MYECVTGERGRMNLGSAISEVDSSDSSAGWLGYMLDVGFDS